MIDKMSHVPRFFVYIELFLARISLNVTGPFSA